MIFGTQADEYEDNPMLPDVPYKVHDKDRPQPPVVETGGAIAVAPPSDAIVLFDGSDLSAWEGPFKLKDGLLVAADGDLKSREEFGAVQLHFEWRIPQDRKVNGQSGGNSGVFMMGTYEVQVLQSHNNKTYPDGQAGSLYGQYPPLVNATAPQGEWQSYDILFTPPVYNDEGFQKPATLTLLHNGVVVQNARAYMGPSVHAKLTSYPETHAKKGPLRIQFHGDPVEYRNIWIRPIGEIDQAEAE